MSLSIVLIISAIVQLMAAFYALTHIKWIGFSYAWVVIAIAFVLMGVRRLVPLYFIVTGQPNYLEYENEFLGLVLSCLLLAGLFGITGLFREYRESIRIIGEKNESLTFALRELDAANIELTEAKEILRAASRYTRNLLETSLDPMVTISPAGKVTDVNKATERITGVVRDVLVGSDFSDYFTEPELARLGYRTVFDQGQVTDYPLSVRSVSGAITPVLYNASVYRDEGGQVLGVFAAARDISERKAAEEKILGLLEEKELILKEVHHRVKNNMGTIASLLTLQLGAHRNTETDGILQDAVARVQSMMVLYDRLYRSENPHEMSIRDFLPSLITGIVHIFPQSDSVNVTTALDDIVLKASVLTPLGIIVNELITNSMKYAFTDNVGGEIHISAKMAGSRVVLEYSDSGKGLPESITPLNSTGFGMQLIKGLIEQLGGNLRIERGLASVFVFEFEV